MCTDQVVFNQLLTDKQLGHFQFLGSFEVIPKYLINDSIVNFWVFTYILLPSFLRKSNSIPSSLTPFLYTGKNHLENLIEGEKIQQEMCEKFLMKTTEINIRRPT